MFLSRTITAPTLARLQVERSATCRVIVRKYWSQLNRSLIDILSSLGSLQPLASFGRLRTLVGYTRFDECKRNRRKCHGQGGQEQPADDLALCVEWRLGVDRRRMTHTGERQNQDAPDDPAEPSPEETERKQKQHREAR